MPPFQQMSDAKTLLALIQRLDEFEDRDRSHPLVIYAQGGSDAGWKSPARICARGEEGAVACPLDPSLSEILSVEQAREVIEVWSAWRNGLAPSPEDRFRAVMFYSRYGTFLPAEPDCEGM